MVRSRQVERRAGASTAPPKDVQVVKQLNGSISDLLRGMQMPLPAMVRCSVGGELQPGEQQVRGKCDLCSLKETARVMLGSCMRPL
jgi:hypothetical protein